MTPKATSGTSRQSKQSIIVMKRAFLSPLLSIMVLWPLLSVGQTDEHWLAERAASSDIVALAQLDRIDYEYERDLPVDGEAWFRPLITYKSAASLSGLFIIREQGLSENECYFPRMAPWDERPRYLLFLVRDKEKSVIEGHPDGCAIEILVANDGSYAARWPQPAFGGESGRGDEALRARVEEMNFQGPGARIDAGDMLGHQRRARAERDFMKVQGHTLIPTRGIELSELRQLMQPGLETEEADAQERERLRQLRDRMLESGNDPADDDSDG